jgi:hypothetical protein
MDLMVSTLTEVSSSTAGGVLRARILAVFGRNVRARAKGRNGQGKWLIRTNGKPRN